jgi:hypothetical protein
MLSPCWNEDHVTGGNIPLTDRTIPGWARRAPPPRSMAIARPLDCAAVFVGARCWTRARCPRRGSPVRRRADGVDLTVTHAELPISPSMPGAPDLEHMFPRVNAARALDTPTRGSVNLSPATTGR